LRSRCTSACCAGRRLPSRRRPGPVSEIFMGGGYLYGLTDADFKKADAAKDKT